jgi:hypothetical protein
MRMSCGALDYRRHRGGGLTVGIIVTITGKAFGSRRRTSCVKFGTVKCGTYISWSNTRIKVRVPVKAAFGKRSVRVTTAGGMSNAKTFTVKR